MATRRMMSLNIMDNPPFINCSISARYLYLEITVRADDDGFFGAASRLIGAIGCTESDLQELIDCGLIIRFNSGVLVVRDWLLANKIRKERYTETIFRDEYSSLEVVNKRYVRKQQT